MRASQFLRYGPPDVLHVAEVAAASAGPGEVLVSVHGSGVNPLDTRIRRGGVAIATGFSFPQGTGIDFAGEVVAVGSLVTDHAVGDRIWGFLPGLPARPTLAAAELLAVKPGTFSTAPASIELRDAAALPLAGSAALLALRDHLHLREGERLLVRGASGGVGTAAVQLAAAMGAEVTAIASADTLQMLRDLGAHAALDYHSHGPTQLERFDVILDLNGHRLPPYRKRLARRGRMLTTALAGAGYILFSAIYGPKRIRTLSVSPRAKVLEALAGYVDGGNLAPIIDTVHPLADVAKAHAAVEAGSSRGKHVIDVRA